LTSQKRICWITESTYELTRTQPGRSRNGAIERDRRNCQSGGNVLVPAFARRAQRDTLAIRTSAILTNSAPIYVDGLVRAVTDTFRDNLEPLRNCTESGQKIAEPFFNEKANPKIIPISHVRERPLAIALPMIVASSECSVEAHLYYAKTLLERENAHIYQRLYRRGVTRTSTPKPKTGET